MERRAGPKWLRIATSIIVGLLPAASLLPMIDLNALKLVDLLAIAVGALSAVAIPMMMLAVWNGTGAKD